MTAADKRMEVKNIAVIGAGVAGRGIARAAALAGYRTILEDVSHTALDQGVAWVRRALEQAVSRGELEAAARDVALKNLATVSTIEGALREADLILETLPEEMEMKIELFTIFDKFAKPNAIFASSTASLSITEIASVTFSADRCIGVRFTDPIAKDGVLELVKGLETSEETVAVCSEIGRRMGKTVVIVDESSRSADGYSEPKVSGAGS